MPDLGSTLSLNSSAFAAGIATARAKLTELNTALIENRNKMKEVSKEAQELQKRERELSAEMKDGGTKEQQQEMQQLRDRIGQVNAELGTLRTREREIQSDIRKASNELDNQKNGMNNLANAGDGVANSLKKIETGLKSVFTMAATKKLVDFFIGSNAEMEQYTTSFEVMLGDMKKAQSLMGELTDLAAVTPMELTDVVPIGTLLMNYGVAADELIDKMTQLGDLSQGNAVKFQRVSLAYGQMLAKGKVTGEELRQMTEAGVPLLQALADTLGVTTAEVQDMISKSKVGITELDAAIASMTTGTGQFAGMMEKQSQTFSGMLSTLKDNIAQFGRDAGEDAFAVVKQSLAEFMTTLEKWRNDGTLKEIAKELGKTVEDVINIIKTAITIIWNCKEGILAFAVALGTFKAAISIGNVVSATVSAIKSFKTAVDAAKVSQMAFNAVGAANPFVLIASLAASAIAGVVAFGTAAYNAAESTKQLAGEIKSFGDSAKSAATEQAKLEDVIKKYEDISKSVDGTINRKDELAQLQERLNSLYGDEKTGIDLVNGSYEEQIGLLRDLSSAEKTRQINQITADLEEAKKKASEVSIHSFEFAFDYNKDNVEYLNREIGKIYAETGEEILSTFDAFEMGADGSMKMVLQGDIETQIEVLEKLQTAFLNSGEASGSLAGAYNKIYDQLEAYKAIQDGIISGEEALAILNGDLSVSFDEVADSAENAAKKVEILSDEDRKKTIDDLTDATKNLVSEFGSLTDTLKALQNGEAISYEKMQALINIYPELANHIQVTADGYVVETGALGDLNTALVNSANAQIEAENAKTRAAIEGAKERISLYEKEAQAAGMYEHDPQKVLEIGKRISEERAYITELESKLAVNSTLPDYFASNKGSSSGKTSSAKKEDSPTLKSISSYAKTANSAFTEMKDKGELALSTVQALIDAGYESALQYDSATGKWTISAEKYKMAAESQIEAAKKVKGVTETEQNALETLRKSLDSVTNGTYELSNAQEKLSTISGISKNMSTLSGAVSEQKKSGALSTDTVADIIGTEYEKALTVGVDGKITLDTDKLKTVLSDEIDKAIKDLEESLKTAEKGDVPALEAQIQAFKTLKESISEVTEGLYGVKEKLVSDEEIKAIEDSANRRLKLIDAELKAKQKLRDETLKAIDEEVQARKRLTEDNDIQRQIDQVMAQLKYSQLDDFSRSQLERKLQSLKNDKADMLWERGIEDRKAAVNEQFDADSERLNAEKDAINNSLEVLNKLNDTVASGISDLGETIKAAMEAVKPDSTVNITLNNADKMTADQLYAFIEQQYGSTGAI